MAGHGSQPGERQGGRQKGSKNKNTIERENLISRAIRFRHGRKSCDRPAMV